MPKDTHTNKKVNEKPLDSAQKKYLLRHLPQKKAGGKVSGCQNYRHAVHHAARIFLNSELFSLVDALASFGRDNAVKGVTASRETLASLTHKSVATIDRWLKVLSKEGWLLTEHSWDGPSRIKTTTREVRIPPAIERTIEKVLMEGCEGYPGQSQRTIHKLAGYPYSGGTFQKKAAFPDKTITSDSTPYHQ
jgi:hypothetical protein